jgi:hypothetical protein
MRGTGIDSEVEIYAMKQSNEHRYMELKKGGAIETAVGLVTSNLFVDVQKLAHWPDKQDLIRCY